MASLSSSLIYGVLFAPLLLLLSLRLSCATVDVKIAKDMLDEVCEDSQDPKLCTKILNADPRTATANLYGVTNISINLALINATDTSDYIRSLLKDATGTAKERYEFCLIEYLEVIDTNMPDAANDLQKGDYNGANLAGVAGNTLIKNCDGAFMKPTPVENPLAQRNHYGRVLTDDYIRFVSSCRNIIGFSL